MLGAFIYMLFFGMLLAVPLGIIMAIVVIVQEFKKDKRK